MGAYCILQFVKQDLKAKQFYICFEYISLIHQTQIGGICNNFLSSTFMDSRFYFPFTPDAEDADAACPDHLLISNDDDNDDEETEIK